MGNVHRLELAPTVVINEKRYALSDHFGFLQGMIGEAPPGEGRARLIECDGNRHRYLWAFDVDRKQIRMWRVSDGDEKTNGALHHFASDIVKLERARQLNRVTASEFDALEQTMRERTQEVLASLKAIIRRDEDEWDRLTREIAREVYAREIAPTVERRWAEIDQGVIPFGFKLREWGPRSPRTQRRMFVLTQALASFTTSLVYAGVRARGLDPEKPPRGGDFQAVEWARGDVIEELYEKVSNGG